MLPLPLFLSIFTLSSLTPHSIAFSPHTPYGSKARYNHVAGNISAVQFQCKPVSLFSVHRHGSRNIGTKTVNKINFLVSGLRSAYAASKGPPAGLEWILDFTHDHKNNKDLIIEGYDELYGQGVRFGKVFSHLFQEDMKSNKFASSYKTRCVNSALSFLYGVYGNKYHVQNASEILKNDNGKAECDKLCKVFEPLETTNNNAPFIDFDPLQNHLLRYYKDCKNYVTKEKDKLVWQYEPKRYLTRTPMVKLTDRISKRLGATVSPHDVITLHIMCTLETGFPRLMHNSHWCSLFEKDELYTTAYYLDLMRYAGKMMPEAVAASCVLWQEGLLFLNTTRGANVKFAHTETLFPLLAHIGYLTEPMLPGVDRFKRQFFGDVTPFGSNLAVVAMNCDNSDDLIVQFLLNEKEIGLEECGTPCKLSKLLEIFSADKCDFVEICEGTDWSHVELLVFGVLVICFVDIIRRVMF